MGDHLSILAELTGTCDWPLHRARLARFSDIDQGIAVRLTDSVAQLMPHGGPRIVQKLVTKLIALGASALSPDEVTESEGETQLDPDPLSLYPEAADEIEALTLATLARAASPLAVDLILDQPRRWRSTTLDTIASDDLDRSQRLNRLIVPPVVVLAGPANVGKSTLSNALLGRAMSITLDQLGTTRDYVTGRIEFAGLVVDWHDTPGLRETDDPIERCAIDLARALMVRADLLIAMAAPGEPWPRLPRDPELWVMNKCDLDGNGSIAAAPCPVDSSSFGRQQDRPLRISATRGDNLSALVETVRARLVPAVDLTHSGPWLFDGRLPRR